jgi:threonine synthase
MNYVSTRGEARATFADVLLGGPAPDGGLWLPEEWPLFKGGEIRDFGVMPYPEVAFRVMRPFIGNAFSDDEFFNDIEAAYAGFSHSAVVPLRQIGPGRFLLELFHGPTLAFKDVALQLIGRLFARALKKRGKRATVIVATSGDTGSAAIAALKGQPNLSIIVLHPKGRVSDVQRRQMTTVLDDNVFNIALQGTFDDTQNIVKALFADKAFSAKMNLTAVNSINFARIAAQAVYYFTAGASLGGGYGRPVSFVVPTGNFGDVFAGEAAWRMRLPVEKLIVATNENDILARALSTGVYASGNAKATLSPSMDIQVASNFERALFEAAGRDAAFIAEAMASFAKTRELAIDSGALDSLRVRYAAAAASDSETIATIKRVYEESGALIDPHTAVAAAVARKFGPNVKGPSVILSTAHPAKFPEPVRRATGITPELPAHMSDLVTRKERSTTLPNKVDAVRDFILESVAVA